MAYKKNWDDLFTLLDSNNSNTITAEDATHAAKQYAQNLGKPENSAEVQGLVNAQKSFLAEFIKSFDTNKDNAVTREELHKGVQKHFVGKSADQFPAFWKTHVEQGFHHADINKNGDLSLEETVRLVKGVDPHAKDEDIKAAFHWATKQSPSGKFDAKAYSHVLAVWATSEKEVPEVQTLTATFRPRGGHGGHGGHAQYQKNWDNFFTILDVNKSNTITIDDAVQTAKQYAALLRKPENAPEVQEMVRLQKSFLAEFIKSFDTNKDTAVTREELHKGVQKNFVGKSADQFPAFWRQHIQEAFHTADLNKSGDLSLEETTKLVKGVDPHHKDQDIKAAFDWAIKHSSSGKFDAKTFEHVMYVWATSEKEVPEVQTLTVSLAPIRH